MVTDFTGIISNSGAISFSWNTDQTGTPTYYIYKNGVFSGEQIQNYYVWSDLKDDQLIRFEVFDDTTSRPEVFFDNYFYFDFYVTDINNIKSFEIQEKVNTEEYKITKSVFAKTGVYHYSFQSDYYNDDDDVTIKITPILLNNNKGEYFEINKRIVTYPNNINSYIYSDTNNIFIDIKTNFFDTIITTNDMNEWFDMS